MMSSQISESRNKGFKLVVYKSEDGRECRYQLSHRSGYLDGSLLMNNNELAELREFLNTCKEPMVMKEHKEPRSNRFSDLDTE